MSGPDDGGEVPPLFGEAYGRRGKRITKNAVGYPADGDTTTDNAAP